MALLMSCSGRDPIKPPQAQMRLEDLTTKVDTAAVDAAKLTATAEILTEEGKADPTQAKILAAYNARVAAAIEVAAAAALKKQKDDAKKDAAEAAKQAKKDAAEETKAASLAAWVNLTRWIGLGGVAIGMLAGGILFWLGYARYALPVAACLIVTGLAVVGYGATIQWLPIVLLGLIILSGIVWAILHARDQKVVASASKVIDLMEVMPDKAARSAVSTAKEALGAAVKKSGMGKVLEKLRGVNRDWKPAGK